MILKHWELEKKLTKILRDSTTENRWEIFEKCYTKLYNELDWINEFVDSDLNLGLIDRYWLFFATNWKATKKNI